MEQNWVYAGNALYLQIMSVIVIICISYYM